MTNNVTDQMIREAAYFLWEKAGCPQGTGEEFWIQAHVQFFGEPETGKKTSAKTTKKPVKKKSSSKK